MPARTLSLEIVISSMMDKIKGQSVKGNLPRKGIKGETL